MQTPRRILILFIAAALPALAAERGASLAGVVTDPQGRPVAGAKVTLFASDGHAEWRGSSDAAGAYRLQQLASGDYLVEASAPGFSVGQVKNIHLERDAEKRVDLALVIAAVTQQVVVTASGTPQTVDQV